jgi:UPF0042 nucleotide-binding protein
MNFLVVSGLSGSGKTIALQALEDMGYYCADNLPAVLLPEFAKRLLADSDASKSHAAVAIDSRNRGFLKSLEENLAQLESLGLDCRVIFLEAEESVLLKRFSTTRRKHPLTNQHTPLMEGIRLEKQLLAPLAANADKHIDTTNTTPHELRGLVRDFAGEVHAEGLSLLVQSFGYKHGTPLDADFVFDLRCLPNPYWKPELRDLTGQDQAVIDYLNEHPQVQKMIEAIGGFIENWLPYFEAEHRSYITVAVGCTGGQHRSVYVANALARRLAAKRLNVQTRHRELL